MKTILFLILYSFSFCIAKGQLTRQICFDSNFVVIDCPDADTMWASTLGNSNLFIYDTIYHGLIASRTKPKNDTVKVYLLYSDTEKFTNNSVVWLLGYKVYNYTNNEIIYLDEQKNKLNKSIVVWQDIEKEK